MKKGIFLTLILTLLIACNREDTFMDTGTITGQDPRDCMCCGGWFIEIRDTMYRFDQLPPNNVIDLSTITYPMKVKLDWKKKEIPCLGDEIEVLKMVSDE